ncbi:MAG: hypothetical protein ABR975_03525 [Vulcanimicrobiaceae bacterium]
MVEGARIIAGWRSELDPELRNAAFRGIYGFESETEEYLVGEQRTVWAPEYVARIDARIADYIRRTRSSVFYDCQVLIEHFAVDESHEDVTGV